MRIARDLYPDRGLTTLSASISYDSHQRFHFALFAISAFFLLFFPFSIYF